METERALSSLLSEVQEMAEKVGKIESAQLARADIMLPNDTAGLARVVEQQQVTNVPCAHLSLTFSQFCYFCIFNNFCKLFLCLLSCLNTRFAKFFFLHSPMTKIEHGYIKRVFSRANKRDTALLCPFNLLSELNAPVWN